MKVEHAALSAAANRAESWSSSTLKDPKSLWTMETTGGMLMTHGPGGWLIDSFEVSPSKVSPVGTKDNDNDTDNDNTEIDEPFSLCVVPSAFKGLVDKLKGSRNLDVSFPMVRGMRRLCFNAGPFQLVDPKAKLLDASKADQLLIDVSGEVWTARVGVQHLLNSLKPVAMAAADPEQNRAMAKATLRFTESMEFTAEATDGRILVRSEGLLTFFSQENAELVLSTGTLNRLVSLLGGVPQADSVSIQLVETELDGAPAGQMLSITFENSTVEALLYLDSKLVSQDLGDLVKSAKAQHTDSKKNSELLTELRVEQSTRSRLKTLSDICSQILLLRSGDGDLTAIAQTDSKDNSDQDDWFSSLPLQIGGMTTERQIHLNGHNLVKVFGLFAGKVKLRLLGCDPERKQRVKALVVSHAEECLPHLDVLLIGLNVRS